MHVVEVLHATVQGTEHDHGVKFLGNDCRWMVGTQTRHWKLQDRRVIGLFRRRHQSIARAYVDLDSQTRPPEKSPQTHTNSVILLIISNVVCLNRRGFEQQAVISHRRVANLAEDCPESFVRKISKPQEIDIAGGAARNVPPQGEQHRTFQHKAVAIPGRM